MQLRVVLVRDNKPQLKGDYSKHFQFLLITSEFLNDLVTFLNIASYNESFFQKCLHPRCFLCIMFPNNNFCGRKGFNFFNKWWPIVRNNYLWGTMNTKKSFHNFCARMSITIWNTSKYVDLLLQHVIKTIQDLYKLLSFVA